MDKVTLENQIRILEGIKDNIEEIRYNIDTYLIGEPRRVLEDLRSSAFPKEVADSYEQKFLEPDTMELKELKERIIYPSIAYIEEQIAGLQKILNKLHFR